MKAQAGIDEDIGLVYSLVETAAKCHDSTQRAKILHFLDVS